MCVVITYWFDLEPNSNTTTVFLDGCSPNCPVSSGTCAEIFPGMTSFMYGFGRSPYMISTGSRARYARINSAGRKVRTVGKSHVRRPCREAAMRNQVDFWKLSKMIW